MSSENEGKHLPDDITELKEETQKASKISYTRDFLLSFSDLDACKKLPSGFDQSLLSEFEDTSQDRQRTSGGLNSFKRSNEYGSSPPTRGDSSSYSRGVHGRWEGRSVRSDKDGDSSQSDLDSDSARRYGNQSKRSWQVPEHDGLLGSGSFPRPTGYAAGSSAPKSRPNEHYQLNRSTEPYQPPRPYKAVPHSRRDTDAFNDETFGSSEHTSKDRAEEERKRRASFELMRKEHHKSFQDKKFDKNPDDFDISTLVDESNDEKRSVKRGGESEEPIKPPAKSNDPEKSSIPSQTPASRPLVPPGFNSTPVDRSSGPKVFTHSHSSEAQSVDNLVQGKSNSTVHTTSDDLEEKKLAQDIGIRKQRESLSSRASINNQSGKGLELSSILDVSKKTAGAGSILYDKTNIAQASEASRSSEGTEQVTRPSILDGSNQDQSASILDKLFSSSLALNETSSSSVVEHHDSKANDLQAFQSSKFARWFNEEEKKPGNDQSSGHPNDLLSLIVGEQGGSRVSGIKSDRNLPTLSFQNSDIVSAPVTSFDQLHIENKSQPVSAVLTCEDLEQSMLSEVGIDGSIPQPSSVQIWTNNPNGKTEPPKANTDNLASRHLLSLLQMSPDSEMSSNIDTSFPGNARGFEEPVSMSTVHSSRDARVRSNPGSTNNSLTLETLFGSAFMKELQSVGAPVSSQRGAAGGSTFPNSHGSDDPQLPEEDSLIFATDPMPTLESLRSIRVNQELPFIRGGPYDIRDSSGGNNPYQNPSSQPPAAAFAQLLRPQLGVQFPQMDSRPVNIMNSQMKFMGPGEGVTHHHDPSPPSHQMQMNMARPLFHHLSSGLSGFEQPIPHHVLQQQRHMHQGPATRGLSMSPHPNRNAHPNFGGLGMAMQGPEVGGGSNHPEALQRLIEMELRSNPKQIHSFGSGGQSRGNLGHELDMSFGFR